MLEIFFISLIVGSVAGVLAGLMGLGGGLIIVPILAWVFSAQGFAENLIMLMAVATSLATIVFTSISSVIAHQRLGSVIWLRVLHLVPGIIIGSTLGAVLAEQLSAKLLTHIYIAFLIAVAIQMAFKLQPSATIKQPATLVEGLIGVVIGIMSAILGIGGGTLTVPYLSSCQLPMRNAVAISSACGLPIAFSGTLSYAFLGWNLQYLPEWSLGYVYMPAFIGIVLCSVITAPIGAKLAYKLPAQKLKRYFSLFLLLMAAKMMWL